MTDRIAQIVERIRNIPKGQVQSYGGIDPAAPRLVGRVLATTHRDLPWHRVVRADGTIPQGERQRQLLRKEGVPMRGDRVDMKRARASPSPLDCHTAFPSPL
jgi:methylated-DNA-protein-cysteine methyltransferase related protein